MTSKEDQQPMTTREKLVAIADNLDRIAPGDGPAAICAGDRRIISNALRLASRQEVSVAVEELEEFIKDKAYPTFDDWEDDFARALLAKYFITKRTTEG